MQQYTGLLGVVFILALGWALSTDRRAINRRTILAGVGLQFAIAFLFLRFPPVAAVFTLFATGVTRVIGFAEEGTRFVFGNAADSSAAWGFIFAVKVLPIIVFFASLMAVLYHLGVMQRVVAALAVVLLLVNLFRTKTIADPEAARRELRDELRSARDEARGSARELREEVTKSIDATQASLDRVRGTLDQRVRELQEGNERKLDEMRRTVDEKLHDTLEKRLAEESEIGSSDRDVAQSDMDWPARCAQFGRRGMRNSGTR